MISSKTARLVELCPKPIVKFIAKNIIDKYLNKYADIKIEGYEKIKAYKRPIIFICNHLSNSDGLVLRRVLKDEEVTFVAGVKLSNNPMTNLGISVTNTITIQPNTADKAAMSQIIETLRQGKNITIFPEGTRSRTGSMIEGKKGILLIAKLSKATIIPIGLYGTEELLPICDEDMGSEKFHHADVFVKFGEAVSLPEKVSGEGKTEYEDRAMKHIMTSIAMLLPEKYRGIYK